MHDLNLIVYQVINKCLLMKCIFKMLLKELVLSQVEGVWSIMWMHCVLYSIYLSIFDDHHIHFKNNIYIGTHITVVHVLQKYCNSFWKEKLGRKTASKLCVATLALFSFCSMMSIENPSFDSWRFLASW